MKRTNIYLDEIQAATLDDLAHSRGISRAELIRRLLDGAIGGTQTDRLSDDLAAIDASFGVLREGEDFVARGPDERSHHLERIARR
jgi:hypothetical protein